MSRHGIGRKAPKRSRWTDPLLRSGRIEGGWLIEEPRAPRHAPPGRALDWIFAVLLSLALAGGAYWATMSLLVSVL